MHDRHVQHARKEHVVDVVALALDEARVFLALHARADRTLDGGVAHAGTSSCAGEAANVSAACCTAFTMF